MELTAYRLGFPEVKIVPASKDREWMLNSPGKFAQRCLPLLIANQAGWFILNPSDCAVILPDDTNEPKILQENGLVSSHFGSGIVTFHIPFLFSTASGYNLLARGPSNWPIDALSPLEGVVETDWMPFTFTMNWQITRRNQAIVIPKDYPICMILPQRRHELEEVEPEELFIHEAPEELKKEHGQWCEARGAFLNGLKTGDQNIIKQGWQKDYFQGRKMSGAKVPEHQTKLMIKPFQKVQKRLD